MTLFKVHRASSKIAAIFGAPVIILCDLVVPVGG